MCTKRASRDQSAGLIALTGGLTWLPTPRYLLRKHCVLRLLHGIGSCRVLEIGCGAGGLLWELAQLGYTGLGLDVSQEAVGVASRLLAPYGHRVQVRLGDYGQLREQFDVVLSLDVLEHIEDDKRALLQWRDLLTPDGHLIISVPARERLWDYSDEAVGHFRRYEKEGLVALLEGCGFEVTVLWCYGFPLSNLVAWVANRMARTRERRLPRDAAARTRRSSLVEVNDARLIRFLAPKLVVAPFAWLQMLFLRADLGTGYVVLARQSSRSREASS